MDFTNIKDRDDIVKLQRSDYIEVIKNDYQQNFWHRKSVSQNVILISASDDKTIKLWGLDTKKNRKIIKILYGHCNSVKFLAFLPSLNEFISGSIDGTIKIWDIENDFRNCKTLSNEV